MTISPWTYSRNSSRVSKCGTPSPVSTRAPCLPHTGTQHLTLRSGIAVFSNVVALYGPVHPLHQRAWRDEALTSEPLFPDRSSRQAHLIRDGTAPSREAMDMLD